MVLGIIGLDGGIDETFCCFVGIFCFAMSYDFSPSIELVERNLFPSLAHELEAFHCNLPV